MNDTSRRNFIGALVAGETASTLPMALASETPKNEWKDLKPGIYAAIGGYLQSCVWYEPTKENHDKMIQTLNSMLRSSWQEGYLHDFEFSIEKHTKTELVVKFGWQEKEGMKRIITTCTVYNRNFELEGKDVA